MNSYDRMFIKEEIKIEIPEYYLQSDYDYQCSDEIEIGNEIKTDSLRDVHALDKNFQQSEDTEYRQSLNSHYDQHCKRQIQAKHISSTIDSKRCNKCEKIFCTASYLRYHEKICGQRKNSKLLNLQYSCDHCPFKTLYKTSLIGHVQAKHSQGPESLNKCDKCGRSYAWKTDLRRHSKFCGLSKDSKRSLMRYSCDHCDFKTNQKPKIQDHILAMHLPKNANSNVCGKCKKSYSNRTSLSKHVKICGVKRVERFSKMDYFYCDECEYKTHFKNALVKHVKSQHLNETCRCLACGKSYKSSVSLYQHVKYSCKKLSAKAKNLKKVNNKNFDGIKVES